jgi:hypothetical protein
MLSEFKASLHHLQILKVSFRPAHKRQLIQRELLVNSDASITRPFGWIGDSHNQTFAAMNAVCDAMMLQRVLSVNWAETGRSD